MLLKQLISLRNKGGFIMNISKNSWCYKFNNWMCVHLDSDHPSKIGHFATIFGILCLTQSS
jgi:hypothetical protein